MNNKKIKLLKRFSNREAIIKLVNKRKKVKQNKKQQMVIKKSLFKLETSRGRAPDSQPSKFRKMKL